MHHYFINMNLQSAVSYQPNGDFHMAFYIAVRASILAVLLTATAAVWAHEIGRAHV